MNAVADLAAAHAAAFDGSEFARVAGLLHDIGKSSDAFQDYLAACEREPDRRHPTVDHKGAGTLAAIALFEPLAFVIDGHHGGLPDSSDLWARSEAIKEDAKLLALIQLAQDRGWLVHREIELPLHAQTPEGLEVFLRMAFSALVDADHTDTEAHFSPKRAALRTRTTPKIGTLSTRLADSQTKLTGLGVDPLSQARHSLYLNAKALATGPRGWMRLRADTGMGKTLSGLSFALDHARQHCMERVITAVPYLSITDQITDVYRSALAEDRAVLEHHSGVRDEGAGAEWREATAQTWDAPVIVTTTVQLLESLFENGPARCRKLHRIVGSVILLDEVQTFPAGLLQPTLAMLGALVRDYGCTVVLSTATQPSFHLIPGFAHLSESDEIAIDPSIAAQLPQRVRYEWPALDGSWDWQRVAAEMASTDRVMAVVNTRAQARNLFDALQDEHAAPYHLSASMCAAHRRTVLTEVRRRLLANTPCQLVATQVVEAGIDVDFDMVLRAFGPLDRIAQAAGRCNREARQDFGRVVVFAPENDEMPAGAYKAATGVTKGMLRQGIPDMRDPGIWDRYYARLWDVQTLDAYGIGKLRSEFAFKEVDARYQLITDVGEPVLVPWTGAMAEIEAISARLRRPREGRGNRLLLQAQPYLVGLRRRDIERANADIEETPYGIWIWHGRYDETTGVDLKGEGAWRETWIL